MYNKNTYRKTNDKKLLHKIGKRWVTISIAMLALLGGGMVASSTTHAANVTPNTQAQTVAVKNNINHQLQKPQASNMNLNQNVKASVNDPKTIQSSATDLHDKLVASNIGKTNSVTSRSTTQSSSNSNVESLSTNSTSRKPTSSSNNSMTTLNLGTESEQNRSWNYVGHRSNLNNRTPVNNSGSSAVNDKASGNQITPISSSSAKLNTIPSSAPIHQKGSYNSAYANYLSLMNKSSSYTYREGLHSNNVDVDDQQNKHIKTNIGESQQGQITPSDDHWIGFYGTYVPDGMPDTYLSDSQAHFTQTGTYRGLTYKYDPTLKAIEFTGGTMQPWQQSDTVVRSESPNGLSNNTYSDIPFLGNSTIVNVSYDSDGNEEDEHQQDSPYIHNYAPVSDIVSVKFDKGIDYSNITNSTTFNIPMFNSEGYSSASDSYVIDLPSDMPSTDFNFTTDDKVIINNDKSIVIIPTTSVDFPNESSTTFYRMVKVSPNHFEHAGSAITTFSQSNTVGVYTTQQSIPIYETDIVEYMVDNNPTPVRTTQANGYQFTQFTANDIPKGYHATSSNTFTYDGGDHIVNIAPNVVNNTIRIVSDDDKHNNDSGRLLGTIPVQFTPNIKHTLGEVKPAIQQKNERVTWI